MSVCVSVCVRERESERVYERLGDGGREMSRKGGTGRARGKWMLGERKTVSVGVTGLNYQKSARCEKGQVMEGRIEKGRDQWVEVRDGVRGERWSNGGSFGVTVGGRDG